MAEINCGACEEIRQASPEFVVNGLTDDICTSLSNNTGLNPSDGRDNCDDLHNLNDCLIGNMENEVDAYDVCDWKTFMKMFIPNIWTTIKALICAICGIWAQVSSFVCLLNALSQGRSLTVGEDSTDGSYVVAGKGVTFLKDDDSSGLAQVTLRYIGGGLVRVQGTLRFSTTDFTDSASCYNFDTNGEDPRKSKSRKGNKVWNNTAYVKQASLGGTVDSDATYRAWKTLGTNGELLYEIRLKKSQYPFIKGLYSGIAAPTGGGAYQVNLVAISEGNEAHGQNNDSPKHVVPEGYIYIQARMINIGYLNATLEHHYSPRGFMGISLNPNEVDC